MGGKEKGQGAFSDKTSFDSRWRCGSTNTEAIGKDVRINLPQILPHSIRGSNSWVWKQGEEGALEDKEEG